MQKLAIICTCGEELVDKLDSWLSHYLLLQGKPAVNASSIWLESPHPNTHTALRAVGLVGATDPLILTFELLLLSQTHFHSALAGTQALLFF